MLKFNRKFGLKESAKFEQDYIFLDWILICDLMQRMHLSESSLTFSNWVNHKFGLPMSVCKCPISIVAAQKIWLFANNFSSMHFKLQCKIWIFQAFHKSRILICTNKILECWTKPIQNFNESHFWFFSFKACIGWIHRQKIFQMHIFEFLTQSNVCGQLCLLFLGNIQFQKLFCDSFDCMNWNTQLCSEWNGFTNKFGKAAFCCKGWRRFDQFDDGWHPHIMPQQNHGLCQCWTFSA